MSNNSDKIKQFFLDTILRNHSGLSEAYRNRILAFLGGLYKVFVDFAGEVTKAYGLSNESYVLVNGLFILSLVIFIIVLFFIVFYLFRVSDKKKKFYYVEVLMKERGLL